MNADFARLGVFAANRHIMVGRSDQHAANWIAPIIVSGNGNVRDLKLGVVRRNRAGQRRARMRDLERGRAAQFGAVSVTDGAYPLDPLSHAPHIFVQASGRRECEAQEPQITVGIGVG